MHHHARTYSNLAPEMLEDGSTHTLLNRIYRPLAVQTTNPFRGLAGEFVEAAGDPLMIGYTAPTDGVTSVNIAAGQTAPWLRRWKFRSG